jgi:F-type H+-transporting ATPase subunit delta
MAEGNVSRRYARALVGLAQEGQVVDRIAAELDSFATLLDQDGGVLRNVLGNPGVTGAERRAVLEAVLGRLNQHAHTRNFLRLLMDNGRFGLLPEIRQVYQSMADELANRVRATVRSARPLDAATAQRVSQSLNAATGKQVRIDFQVDATLIGGLVARVGDKVFDASVRARLASMQKALTDGDIDLVGVSAEA